MVATCEHASSASLSTRLQLMGGDAELEEWGRYGPGNSECMAPEDPGAEAAPPGAVLPGMLAPDILVPTMPHGVPPVPGTSVANATDIAGCRRMTGTSNVQLLSFNPMLPSKPGIRNAGSGNGMPQNSAPHTHRIDAGRKDQGWALLDGGSAPPLSDENNPTAASTTAPAIDEDWRGVYQSSGFEGKTRLRVRATQSKGRSDIKDANILAHLVSH
jgi:hypothetical protein